MEPRNEGSTPPYESPIRYEIRNPEGLLNAFNSEETIEVGPPDTFSLGPLFLAYQDKRILGLAETDAFRKNINLDEKSQGFFLFL